MERKKYESRGRLLIHLATNNHSASEDCKSYKETTNQTVELFTYQPEVHTTLKDCKEYNETSDQNLSLGPEKQNSELIQNCTANPRECVPVSDLQENRDLKVSGIPENRQDLREIPEEQNFELISECSTYQENTNKFVSDNTGLQLDVSEIPEDNTDTRATPNDGFNISGSSFLLSDSAIIEIDDPELGNLIETQDFVLDEYMVLADNVADDGVDPPINSGYRSDSPLHDISNKVFNGKSRDLNIIHQNEKEVQRNSCPEVRQNENMVVSDNENMVGSDDENMVVSDDAIDKDSTRTGRPKKGRKRKFESQNREIKKKKVNTNEDYITCKGNIKFSKDFRDYQCSCRLKCNRKLSTEKREAAFKNFYKAGSYEARCFLIQNMVKEVPIKRKRVEGSERRTTSREYFLLDEKVCKNIFMQTLRISSCSINVALSKKKHASVEDGRGKAGGHNKLSNLKTEEVISHISKFPRYVSHYCRSVSESEYLNPETTIPVMYKLYSEEHTSPVSIATYKQIFYNKFNLKWKPLKKDTCNVCDRLVIQKKNNSNSIDLKQKAEQEHNTHLEAAEYARKMMNDQFRKCKNKELEDTECISFDLEKTLPLPRIPTNIIFYKRQLWFYNCGVHDSKDRGFCYTWVEGSAGRGAQEIGSCLRRHILHHIPEGTKHLLLWSDSCGGQNRNIKLILMLKAVLEEHTTLEDITQHFLVSGHSFLRNDSDFSDIESCLKMQQRLYVPTDYEQVIRSCRKKNKLNVERMEKEDFVSTEKLEKSITNRKKSINGEQVNWLKFKIIQVRKSEPGKIFVKSDLKQDDFVEINISKQCRKMQKKQSKKCKQSVSPQHAEENERNNFFSSKLSILWPQGKPISKEKLLDIKSMFHLIPKDCQTFYKELCGSEAIVDDVDGFSGELDFEPEAL